MSESKASSLVFQEGSRRQRAMRVLVAEDTPSCALLMSALLESDGHHVTIAEDGVEAVRMFKAGLYELVLMNIHMPEMDGIMAARAIRGWEAERGSRRVPIIAVSSDDVVVDGESCRSLMDGYVLKPVDKVLLLKAVEKATGRNGGDESA